MEYFYNVFNCDIIVQNYLPNTCYISCSGQGKPSEIIESSSIAVETVEKKAGHSKAKHFQGDAQRVVAQGLGLKKGHTGRAATFTLDVKDAGRKAKKQRSKFGTDLKFHNS